MAPLIPPLLATVALMQVNADSCDRFEGLHRLPPSFEEITSGEGVGFELFVLTDHVCTCDNTPAIDRFKGKLVAGGIFWKCRAAADDERQKHR